MRVLSEEEEASYLPKLNTLWKKHENFPLLAFTNGYLQILFSVSEEDDKQIWIHVSVSRSNGTVPDYRDMKYVKDCFFGNNRYAYQVFPTQEDHYTLPFIEVLHLWGRADGHPVLPDFLRARGGKI